jgi:hypothetical protein
MLPGGDRKGAYGLVRPVRAVLDDKKKKSSGSLGFQGLSAHMCIPSRPTTSPQVVQGRWIPYARKSTVGIHSVDQKGFQWTQFS